MDAPAAKRARSVALKSLAKTMKAQRLGQAVGAVRDVLWEHPIANEDGQIRWQGYTDHYLRTETLAPEGMRLENRITATALMAVIDGDRLQGVRIGPPNPAVD